MKPRTLHNVFVLVFLAGMAGVEAWAATACEVLPTLTLANARIDSSGIVAAGTFVPPGAGGRGANAYANLPVFCRVTATLTPTSDSDIKIELWMPAGNWNGKFLAVGNGGWAGSIPYAAIAAGLADGYATAGTDTGHTGNNADFALGHPEKVIDLAYRSIHEMTVQSKIVLNAHYGSAAQYSYYNGCSQGGRQGLAAAQRYPEDFNGIIAGASAIDQMRMHAARTALNLVVNKTAESAIPRAKLGAINSAVLAACDTLDGVKDGVIENPLQCKFDYAKLTCPAGDGADCLTPAQVQSAKAMTSPIKDPKTGKTLFAGFLVRGSELGWGTLGGPQPLALSISGLQNVVFQDRNWDYRNMDIAADIDRAVHSDNGATTSNNSNLKPFVDRGGKLLMYHGWSDPQVTPMNSVNYYASVVKTVGKKKAADSIRLFMMPGVNHCSGGPGTDTFAKLRVLEDWVERGKAPSRIEATHSTNGTVDKTRPLCPYPQVAKYDGSGDPNESSNFACR